MKSIGGFYYVRADGEDYECKARGSFRKSGNSPVAGDRVNISVPNDGFCAIEEILPRKNKLRRPALANLDILLLVCSTVEPLPNFTIIDKMTAAAVNNNMEPVIVVTKNDLENNKLFPSLSLETGQTSKKLGRGRHTTRVVELFELDGCFVADTPGFSTVDLQRYEMIDKSRLQYCFPEFEKYLGECMFTSCSHTCEKGCRILEALSDGEIEETRHRSYIQMYNEVKDIKSWQIKE